MVEVKMVSIGERIEVIICQIAGCLMPPASREQEKGKKEEKVNNQMLKR